MELTKDRWPEVCKIATKGGFICPAVKNDTCTIFTNDGVKAKERTGCAYKNTRAPIIVKGVKKVRVGQQKQAPKRKTKTGAIEVTK